MKALPGNGDLVGQLCLSSEFHRAAPAGAFHNGPAFTDYFEVRDLLAARHADFATGFSEALLTYALGRPVGFSDDELVKQIVASAIDKRDEYFQGGRDMEARLAKEERWLGAPKPLPLINRDTVISDTPAVAATCARPGGRSRRNFFVSLEP